MTIEATTNGEGGEVRRRGRAALLAALWPDALSDRLTDAADARGAVPRRRRRRLGPALAMLTTAVLAPGYLASEADNAGGRLDLFRAAAPPATGEDGASHGGGRGQTGGQHGSFRADLPSSAQPDEPLMDPTGPDAANGGGGDGLLLAERDEPPGMTFLAPSPGFGLRGGRIGGGIGGGGGGGGSGGGGGLPHPGDDPSGDEHPGDGPHGPGDNLPNKDPPVFGDGPKFDDPDRDDDPIHADRPTDGPQGGAVPEPATWAMMILGFGAVGYALRCRRTGLIV